MSKTMFAGFFYLYSTQGKTMMVARMSVNIDKYKFPESDKEWREEWRKRNKKESGLTKKLVDTLTDSLSNGTIVVVDESDPDLLLIVQEGREFNISGREYKKGQPSNCHRNVASLYHKGEIDGIATGYALVKDGGWRSHTWGIKDNHIVETTNRYLKYFGAIFDKETSKVFLQNEGVGFTKYGMIVERVFLASFVNMFKTDLGLPAQLYKNEPSSELKEGYRGVITKDGDLYTVGSIDEESLSAHMVVTHVDVLHAMGRSGEGYHSYGDYTEVLNVQLRNGVWMLGESYQRDEMDAIVKSKEVKKMIKNFKRKNPGKDVVLKNIL